jgi:hypothetical protein
MRFKRNDRSPYRDEDISEIDSFKDYEKIPHIEGNELLNTLLALIWRNPHSDIAVISSFDMLFLHLASNL